MEVTEIKEQTCSYKIITKEAKCGNPHEENVEVRQNGLDGEPSITIHAGTDRSLYACELIVMLHLLGLNVTTSKSAGRPKKSKPKPQPKRGRGRPRKLVAGGLDG